MTEGDRGEGDKGGGTEALPIYLPNPVGGAFVLHVCWYPNRGLATRRAPILPADRQDENGPEGHGLRPLRVTPPPHIKSTLNSWYCGVFRANMSDVRLLILRGNRPKISAYFELEVKGSSVFTATRGRAEQGRLVLLRDGRARGYP